MDQSTIRLYLPSALQSVDIQHACLAVPSLRFGEGTTAAAGTPVSVQLCGS